MKKLKFLIDAVLMLLGFTIVGELHHFYLDNFMNGITSTTLYLQSNTSENEMKQDALKSAKDHDVVFFVLQTEVKSTFEKEFCIYQNCDEIQKYLDAEYDIEEKNYKSLFSGVLKFYYDDYENISDELLLENHTYYVVGKNEDIQAFKMELINKYAGNHPRYGEKNNESRNTVFIIWLIIYMLLFVLTGYDQLFQQKEVYIRASFGERIYRSILKNIFLDIGVFAGVFLLSFCFLKQFTMAEFYKQISYTAFGIFLVFNSMIYFRWIFLDIKNVLKKRMFSERILLAAYIVKSFTIIFTVLITSANITVILESLEYASQRDFFEEHKDYFYTNLEYKEIIGDNGLPVEDYDLVMEESSKMREVFYQKFFDRFKPIILAYLGEAEGHDIILVNKNTTEYLFEVFPELESKLNHEGYYYIIPGEMENQENVCSNIDFRMENFEDKNIFKDRKIIAYSGRKKVLNIDELSMNGSQYSINPIIVLNTINPVYQPDSIRPYIFKMNYEHDVMYKIDEEMFGQFVEEYGLENHFHTVTNVYEKYEYNWLVLKRLLYINLIFSLLMLFLELIIIRTIISLEFKINAMDLSIKKILGYSYLQRYRQILLISVLGSFLCFLAGIIVGQYIGMSSTLCIALSGMSIFMIDMSVIRSAIEGNERMNIPNILKGEYL